MGLSRKRIIASSVLVLALLAPMFSSVGAIHEDTYVSPGTGPQGSPRTDGQTVVWADGREGIPYTSDVYAATLPEREEFAIATGEVHQTTPDVDGSMVVWSEDGEIQAMDIDSDDQFAVSSGAEDSLPAISGDHVVWVRFDDGFSIWSRNLSTMDDPVHLADLDFALSGRPEIDGDTVLFGQADEAEGDPDGGAGWQLFKAHVDGTDLEVLVEDDAPGAHLNGFDLHGSMGVYAANEDLFATDIDSGDSFYLASNAMTPTTDGRYVFWSDTDHIAETQEERVDLRGYDMLSDSRFVIYQDEGRNVLGNTGGDYLVWSRGFMPPEELNAHAAPISDLIPIARQPDPGATDPNWFYFSETGHYLSYGFKNFWEQSGGLPVFGFPLTIEYDEMNPDLGEFRTVQYFERQRFEYHPENAGTPYETQLGRLGVQDASQRGLLDTEPFEGITEADDDCTWFSETGHQMCGDFRDYWEAHGLDFGDPGVSFRESLALFGYPISEEFVDPDSGLTVQYFERARFEYHPDNPEEYQVLLGRLGADELTQRGWN